MREPSPDTDGQDPLPADRLNPVTGTLNAMREQSDETIAAYRLKVGHRLKETAQALGLADGMTPSWRQAVDHMISRKPDWTTSTWRYYKAAMIFALEEAVALGDQSAEEPLSALRLESQSGARKRGSPGTRPVHKKSFPPEDLEAVIAWLQQETRSEYRDILITWLKAGYYTGLRPIEWGHAHVKERNDTIHLQVRNAKNTNGRANGEYRSLCIGDFPVEQIDAIVRNVKTLTTARANGDFERIYFGCSALLLRANNALWPNRRDHYTLYSLRHACASNLKLVCSAEQVAAILGHATNKTAGEHYGRRRSGRTTGPDGLAVKVPIPDQIAVTQIRKVTTGWSPAKAPKVPPAEDGAASGSGGDPAWDRPL